MRNSPASNNNINNTNNNKRPRACSNRNALGLVLLGLVITVLASVAFTLSVTLHLHATAGIENKQESLQHELYQHTMLYPAKRAGLRGGTQQTNLVTGEADEDSEEQLESIAQLRHRLPPSVWTTAGRNADPQVAALVLKQLLPAEQTRAMQLCGKFLYSSLLRATQVGNMGESTFVATGDIDDMWTRDSAVQMGIYMGRMASSSSSSLSSPTPPQPWLRLIIQGAIRRQAFNIIQDPYANAYARSWKDPASLLLRDRVIGRGGWVATRNYELDSGAYFLTQLYDYYVAAGGGDDGDDGDNNNNNNNSDATFLYRPDMLLQESMIFDAVMLLLHVWIVEQRHEDLSPYRYFELPRGGLGVPSAYTGMTWTGFRPSDDPCQYGYLIPANIHAAAGLERVIELNKRVWKSTELHNKADQLLRDVEDGIQKYGVVPNKHDGTNVYAYEVDGLGGVLSGFDDANVPSLLSIPLLGWSKYDREVYHNTRKMLLSPQTNPYYFVGDALRGIGSPHTPKMFAWPMAFAIEALTQEGSKQEIAEAMVFQIRQSLKSACNDAMHEGVDVKTACEGRGMRFSRKWFEWANAMFVVLMESATGERCDASGRTLALESVVASASQEKPIPGARPIAEVFYQNKYKNDPKGIHYYQGVEAFVPHDQ